MADLKTVIIGTGTYYYSNRINKRCFLILFYCHMPTHTYRCDGKVIFVTYILSSFNSCNSSKPNDQCKIHGEELSS